jgi:hypothetical protein
MRHRPISCERILLGSRSPPPVASLVLQLISEWDKSLVILNRLCDPRATWRNVSSRLWFSTVKISVVGRIEQGTTC